MYMMPIIIDSNHTFKIYYFDEVTHWKLTNVHFGKRVRDQFFVLISWTYINLLNSLNLVLIYYLLYWLSKICTIIMLKFQFVVHTWVKLGQILKIIFLYRTSKNDWYKFCILIGFFKLSLKTRL